MKLIKPSFEIIEQQLGLEGLYKQIELCGRVSYKSEDRITEDSAKGFVDKMIKLGHGAVLEHGTVYLEMPAGVFTAMLAKNNYTKYLNNQYSKVALGTKNPKDEVKFGAAFVTTNMRVLVENNWLDDLQYLCKPTEYHERRICVRFTCDRGISHEFVRHRIFSFLQESSRYCNYSKSKFNNEVTFIQPCWLEDEKLKSLHPAIKDNSPEGIFINNLNNAEKDYLELLKLGWQPQQARAVLPNALKTELIMTGFVSDWKHFFKLRCPGSAHPQARELAIPLKEEFNKRNIL